MLILTTRVDCMHACVCVLTRVCRSAGAWARVKSCPPPPEQKQRGRRGDIGDGRAIEFCEFPLDDSDRYEEEDFDENEGGAKEGVFKGPFGASKGPPRGPKSGPEGPL